MLDWRIKSLILRGTKARAETITYQKTPQTLGGPNKEKTTKEVPIAKKKRSTKGVFFILWNLTFVNYFFNYVIRR